LSNLEKAIERSQPVFEIQCSHSFQMVSVPRLLFGLHWSANKQIIEQLQEIKTVSSSKHEELLALVQREFAKNFRREQSKIESHCPNVFTLRRIESGPLREALVDEKLELQLYCQAPGSWHPTREGGRYLIDRPAQWLRIVGPHVKRLVTLLKFITPVLGPWASISAPKYEELIRSDVKFMEELVKIMPQSETSPDEELVEEIGEVRDLDLTSGPSLRAIRLLLQEQDPQEQWGGLRKILTPEGHYLWLCEHHAREYEL
jgi:hypothetical protein